MNEIQPHRETPHDDRDGIVTDLKFSHVFAAVFMTALVLGLWMGSCASEFVHGAR